MQQGPRIQQDLKQSLSSISTSSSMLLVSIHSRTVYKLPIAGSKPWSSASKSLSPSVNWVHKLSFLTNAVIWRLSKTYPFSSWSSRSLVWTWVILDWKSAMKTSRLNIWPSFSRVAYSRLHKKERSEPLFPISRTEASQAFGRANKPSLKVLLSLEFSLKIYLENVRATNRQPSTC